MMKITYIGHSGFFVEMEDACFLFDYYKGTIPETDGNKKMYVFVSHRHHDHYNEEIFRLQEKFRENLSTHLSASHFHTLLTQT